MDIKNLKLGFSEMMLVLHMVSRVMKNKSTLLECIMAIIIGQLRLLSKLITRKLLEGDSKSSKELVKDVMELCIKNMIFL